MAQDKKPSTIAAAANGSDSPSRETGAGKKAFLRAARRVSIVNTMKQAGNASGAARLSSTTINRQPTAIGLLPGLMPTGGFADDIPLEHGEVEDGSGLSNHVVVSGCTGQIGYFLAELRRPLVNASRQAYHPVLIVTPDMPPNWTECMAAFDDIFWLKGRITNSVDFNRTNIQDAYAVILLATRSNTKQNDEVNLDSEVLFAYLKLEKYVPKSVFLTVELTVSSNMAVLNSTIMRHVRQQRQQLKAETDEGIILGRAFNGAFATKKRVVFSKSDDGVDEEEMTAEERLDQMLKELGRDELHEKVRDSHTKKAEDNAKFWEFTSAEASFWDATNSHHTLPVFSSGKAFVPSTFDSLLCQSFFGSLTPVVCEKLVCGQKYQTMYQIDVPQPFHNRDFLLFYRACNARCINVMGLYRARNDDDGSTLPFVFLAPPPESIIRKGDRAFVFCNPHRLQHALETSLNLPFKEGHIKGTWSLRDTSLPVE